MGYKSHYCSLKFQQILKRVSEEVDKHKVGQFASFSQGFKSLLCVLTEKKTLLKVFSLLIINKHIMKPSNLGYLWGYFLLVIIFIFTYLYPYHYLLGYC